MKKVIIVIARMDIGGAEHLVIEEIREFLRRGWEVHLVTLLFELPNSLLQLVPQECRTHRFRFFSFFEFRSWLAFIRFLKREDPTLVLTNLWFGNTIGRTAALLAGLKERVLSLEHNIYDELKTKRQFFADRILQHFCRRLVAVSGAVRESLIAHGIKPEKIAVAHPAIDLSRFQHAFPSNMREELGLRDQFIWLFVGRLNRQKAVDVLIRAFAKVARGVLLIAGQGPDEKGLRLLARELGAEERVFFLGVRDDIPSLMRSADCLVMPSRWEGFGLVLIEAMAAGVPIVAADFSVVPDIVQNGKTGLIVPRENPEALAEAMEKVGSDKGLRERLRDNAKKELERFTPERHVGALISLLKQ